MLNQFPSHFLFGTATSSYQIEGFDTADGASPSIWKTFSRQSGAVYNGHTGDIAAAHYKNWETDIELMNKLDINSYRFSIAWGRIFPEDGQHVNQKGLDFYNRLVDELLDHNITPMITLYHWDLPVWIQQRGGWKDESIVDLFTRYATTVYEALHDRVPLWLTFNEPWVFWHLGHIEGVHAPGHTDVDTAFDVYKHILQAHKATIPAMRSINDTNRLGVALNFTEYTPVEDTAKDKQAAKRYHEYQNCTFSEPWFKNVIPDVIGHLYGDEAQEELQNIDFRTNIDFLGVNYYTRQHVSHNASSFLDARFLPPQRHSTEMDWEVYPGGLEHILNWLYETYGLPIYITENGAAFNDTLTNGTVNDDQRVDYIQQHLESVESALGNGADIKGYYVWSFLDNFEWSYGYSKRFGIVYVDFDNMERTIKKSGYFYRDYIRSHRNEQDQPAES